MTAREYLQRFFVLQMKLEGKLDEISNLQSMARNVTQVIRETPSGSASTVSRIENAVAGIEDKSRELANDLVHALAARNEIADFIANVENTDERCLLEMRYLGLCSWKTIARRFNFSLEWIFKLHSRALKNLSIK